MYLCVRGPLCGIVGGASGASDVCKRLGEVLLVTGMFCGSCCVRCVLCVCWLYVCVYGFVGWELCISGSLSTLSMCTSMCVCSCAGA